MKKLGKRELKKLQDQWPQLPPKIKDEYKYRCVCDNCGYSWKDDEEYDMITKCPCCPSCKSGEIYLFDRNSDEF